MVATVVNKYKVCMDDPDIVYIGRGSRWGNPFSHKDGTKALYKVETREEAVASYKKMLWFMIRTGGCTKEELIALDGKRLACYCSPQACHGDVLVAAIKWAKGG